MRVRAAVPAVILALCACWFVLRGQQPAPVSSQDRQPADQQVVALLASVSDHVGRLQPMLEQVRVKDWVAKGAPETYVAQLASAQRQIQAIETDMAALAQHPDHMQEAMRGLFRVQAFHRALDPLMGGLRKYQNPALADLILSVAAEDQGDVAKLQDYVLDLANQKEQEYAVVEHEAQRCRATISKEPAAPPKAVRRNP